MKKIILFLMSVLALISCSNTDENWGSIDKAPKSSELFVYSGGNSLTRAWSKTEELGYSIPKNGMYDVWYFIRIDGNIPGEDELNLPANQYFPQTANKGSMISDLNYGTVKANVDWKSCNKKNFPKYIYSTDGSAVQSIIVKEPILEDLITADKNKKYDLSGYLNYKEDLHFIWYICKQQKSDHIWHIDGILTSKDRTNISETQYGPSIIEDYDKAGMVVDSGNVVRKAHVEVDIHQQEHKDWNEIKTSIHLRDTVDVEVFIPIIAESDDFDIRTGEKYSYVKHNHANIETLSQTINIGSEIFELSATVEYVDQEGASGVKITIIPNKEALIAARNFYNDGITYEIHNFLVNTLEIQNIWEELKTSSVKVSPFTEIRGQRTSAYFNDTINF